EPTGAQQSLVEKMLEVKITEMMKEIMPQEFVDVTVSIKYFIETVPVSKNKKQIKKVKLPGFENHVWIPTKTKQIVGIVNQTRTYTTLFIVVSKPISPFNIEVLRQTLSEQLEQIDLLKDDVLKVVYIPHAASNLTGEEEQDQLALLEAKGLIPKKVEEPEESAEEGIPKKKKKPEKLEEDIDLLMKMETTRYLLKAREAYQRDNYDSAITAISEAIDVNPFSPQAYEMLGSIYYRLGWNGMALENWQRALRLEPDNDMLRKYIARLER
ncbi:MAG: tetratricopeptide repeat protein, partial [SAR324 cluster bacterium]|nr:tetratricopeptide repeat protein [SAR324 cluster bacterium]